MNNKQDLSRPALVRAVASKVAANIMLVLFLPDSLSNAGLGKNCGSDNPLEGSYFLVFFVFGKPLRFDLTQQFCASLLSFCFQQRARSDHDLCNIKRNTFTKRSTIQN